MKVYLVNKYYDNCEGWEDHVEYDEIIAIFSTEEKAKDFIKNHPCEEGWKISAIKEDGRTRFDTTIDDIDDWSEEIYYYTIKEMEVQ